MISGLLPKISRFVVKPLVSTSEDIEANVPLSAVCWEPDRANPACLKGHISAIRGLSDMKKTSTSSKNCRDYVRT